jgi:hypothetical protein
MLPCDGPSESSRRYLSQPGGQLRSDTGIGDADDGDRSTAEAATRGGDVALLQQALTGQSLDRHPAVLRGKERSLRSIRICCVSRVGL